VAEGVSHGWAIGTLLGPDGELGRIWSLSRPLTYRALDTLVDRRFISRRGVQPGQGRDRVVVTATARGAPSLATGLTSPSPTCVMCGQHC